MNKKQKEELAKLYIDIGKLIFASLVLGFFQSKTDPITLFIVFALGLTFSIGFFILGLNLFREIK